MNYDDMITCDHCSRVWDGNAQCPCWEFYGFDGFDEEYYQLLNI